MHVTDETTISRQTSRKSPLAVERFGRSSVCAWDMGATIAAQMDWSQSWAIYGQLHDSGATLE